MEGDIEILAQALRKALVEDEEHSPILVKARVGRICDDIRDIKSTLWWMSRIASAVGIAGLGVLTALLSANRIHF